jgi:hypothetical protein
MAGFSMTRLVAADLSEGAETDKLNHEAAAKAIAATAKHLRLAKRLDTVFSPDLKFRHRLGEKPRSRPAWSALGENRRISNRAFQVILVEKYHRSHKVSTRVPTKKALTFVRHFGAGAQLFARCFATSRVEVV